jgi:hypothetical protein
MPTASISSMNTMQVPAPLAGRALRLPGEVADDDRVDADERRREARARDRDERRVEAGRERLREHRLAGAGGPEEEHAALALAAVVLELLARLPDRDDPAHLLLRLGLAADVVELHAPLRVPGSNVLICVRFIARSGPKRIPKFAMKRKKTKTTWIQRAGDERIVPSPSAIEPIVPNHVPPRNSQMIVIATTRGPRA